MKDYYEVSGSDASRIGWVEVSAENGQSGYLWYLKAEADTRARFTDYVEMAMLESVKTTAANSKVDAYLGTDGTTLTGTQGLFDAIEDAGFSYVNNLHGRGTLRFIKEEAVSSNNLDTLREYLNNFKVRIVLTAHPTQFYPGSVLGIINDLSIQECLIKGTELSSKIIQKIGARLY